MIAATSPKSAEHDAVTLALMTPVPLQPEAARKAGCVAEAMAQTMIDAKSLHGFCDVHHLANAGWTATEIVGYEVEARRIADGATSRDLNDDMTDLPAPKMPAPEAA